MREQKREGESKEGRMEARERERECVSEARRCSESSMTEQLVMDGVKAEGRTAPKSNCLPPLDLEVTLIAPPVFPFWCRTLL